MPPPSTTDVTTTTNDEGNEKNEDNEENATGEGNDKMELGLQVMAMAAGWSDHYSGLISSVNTDGTYDVSFDDGDYQSSIPPENIYKKVEESTTISPKQKYKIGQTNGTVDIIGKTDKTGTKISFLPDYDIFVGTKYEIKTVDNRLRELAYLNEGLEIIIKEQLVKKAKRVLIFYFF